MEKCPLKERCLLGQACPGTLKDLKICAPIILKKSKKGVCKYCGDFIRDLFEINQDYEVCFCCFKDLIEAELLRTGKFSYLEVERIIERMRPQNNNNK